MNRRIGSLALLLSLTLVSTAGCPSDPEGGEGQPCRPDESCDGSLICLAGTCQVGPGAVCDGVDCSGHGSCRDEGGAAVCDCDTGHAGAACEDCDLAGGYVEDPPGSGTCVPASCTAGEILGCASATELSRCNASGVGATPEACPGTRVCEVGACLDLVCTPGERGCADAATPELCNPSGTAWEAQAACAAGSVCGPGGTCLNPCELAAAQPSHRGCRFVAVDLDQILDVGPGVPSPVAGTFSLVVTNAHPSEAATITVIDGSGASVPLADPTVPPEGHQVFDLPRQDVEGTGLGALSFSVTSDRPVSVSQLNPNVAAPVSTDASLLLPTDHLGVEYRVLGWPTYVFSPLQLSGYVAIVAIEAGPTQVTVTSPVALKAGGSIPAVAAATPTSFDLQPGEVLSLETTEVDGADISGMHLVATQAVAVFSGHESAMVPTGTGFADHLEEQLLPVSRWVSHHVAAKAPPRGTEVDVWRILAANPNTTVTTSPAQAGTPATLGAGEFLELASGESFEIQADGPVQVVQYLVGSTATGVPTDPACVGGSTGLGDPATALLPGVDHWRSEYVVAGLSTLAENTLTLISPAGNTLSLDGPPLPPGAWIPVGSGAYELAYLLLTPGTRVLTGTQPFGVLQHGYDCDTARAWPGGFDLTP